VIVRRGTSNAANTPGAGEPIKLHSVAWIVLRAAAGVSNGAGVNGVATTGATNGT